jgi:hypothetical protein
LSVRFLLLYLLHLLTLLTFSFLLTSLLFHYPIIFTSSQGRTQPEVNEADSIEIKGFILSLKW